PAWPGTRRSRSTVLAIAGAITLIPILVLLVLSPLRTPTVIRQPFASLSIPFNQFPIKAVTHGQNVLITWPKQDSAGGKVVYIVFDGLESSCQLPPRGAIDCTYPPN